MLQSKKDRWYSFRMAKHKASIGKKLMAELEAKRRQAQAGKTGMVRIEAELARKASMLASATGKDISDILSPMIRDQLNREYEYAFASAGFATRDR